MEESTADKKGPPTAPDTSSQNGNIRQWRDLLDALSWPVLFVIILWCVEGYFQASSERSYAMGNHPRNSDGLPGIVLSPFLHAGIDHLLANTAPLLVIGTGIFYFYKQIATRVLAMIWLFTGFWVWLMAREEYHIGASGLIYGGVVFLFFSGVLRRDVRLLAVSLLVVFLYGSLAWGIFPIDPTQSWETHLSGSIAGLFAAIHYRDRGPRRRLYQWEIDEALEESSSETVSDSEEKGDSTSGTSTEWKIRYDYREKPPGGQ